MRSTVLVVLWDDNPHPDHQPPLVEGEVDWAYHLRLGDISAEAVVVAPIDVADRVRTEMGLVHLNGPTP
jgi:hypothetical protein